MIDRLRWILHDVVDEMDADEARRFLASLDAESQEGMWFDAFAEGFPSRLDAAIAYVNDLRGYHPSHEPP